MADARLQGIFKHRHEEKVAEAAAEQAKAIVDTYWKKNVFNPINCCFYDQVREAEYIKAKEEDVRLRQGRSCQQLTAAACHQAAVVELQLQAEAQEKPVQQQPVQQQPVQQQPVQQQQQEAL